MDISLSLQVIAAIGRQLAKSGQLPASWAFANSGFRHSVTQRVLDYARRSNVAIDTKSFTRLLQSLDFQVLISSPPAEGDDVKFANYFPNIESGAAAQLGQACRSAYLEEIFETASPELRQVILQRDQLTRANEQHSDSLALIVEHLEDMKERLANSERESTQDSDPTPASAEDEPQDAATNAEGRTPKGVATYISESDIREAIARRCVELFERGSVITRSDLDLVVAELPIAAVRIEGIVEWLVNESLVSSPFIGMPIESKLTPRGELVLQELAHSSTRTHVRRKVADYLLAADDQGPLEDNDFFLNVALNAAFYVTGATQHLQDQTRMWLMEEKLVHALAQPEAGPPFMIFFAQRLTEAGRQLLTALSRTDHKDVEMTNQSETRAIAPMMLFISHASADAEVAKAIAELVERAVVRSAEITIICTSVSKYKLDSGADVHAELFDGALSAHCFVALLTDSALTSTYTHFELGARYGSKMSMRLVRNIGIPKLPSPLNGRQATDLSNRREVLRFIQNVAEDFESSLTAPDRFDEEVEELIKSAARK